ncbi:hypothetical protein [Streptomyces guryensis]|uniref:Uncharacterized protein n=1 Tax=Streptomyces guryensis TaxID=2886947 RepID=A0A9Q3VPG1_9ACTN|nr:hypothetical protein [Streptomyces guryensis]MCD9877683.1 hypothetical protein [Streptomyces guryensis]
MSSTRSHGYDDWARRAHHQRSARTGPSAPAPTALSGSSSGKSGLHADGVVGQDTRDSLLDNLQGDGGRRSGCYEHLPSTHR